MPRKKKLPPNVRRHGNGFRAVVAVDGVRHRSPVLPTIERVLVWIDTFRQRDAPKPMPDLTLAAGLCLIDDDLAATEARPATAKYYAAHARTLIAGLGGPVTRLRDIGAPAIRRYVAARRAAGISPQTIVSKELFVLRRMLKLAREAGHDLPDPFVGLRLPRGRAGRFDVLTQDRVAELVRRMRDTTRGERDADIVELVFGTGLRLSEVARLRVSDIDIEARRIAVDGKTGPRAQPFGDGLVPILRRLIVRARGGRIISHRTLERLFPRWQKRLGEPRLACHVLRHSYATALAARVTPWELMRLMGHGDIRQTARYFHGQDAGVRGALDSLRLDPPEQEPPQSP